MSSSASVADALRVGAIKRPHGLRGEVAVEPRGDFPDRIAPGSRLTVRGAGETKELTVSAARRHGTHLLVTFEGCDSLESVEPLAGSDLFVARSTLPASPDFIFDDEVRRFRCVGISGEFLGNAVEFERFGENCCLRIDNGRKTVLVPFVHPIVREISRDEAIIVLDPPEGLFDL